MSAGLTADAARRAVGEKPLDAVRSAVRAARVYAASHEVQSLPALLFSAIRSEWLAPAPPSSYASDRGERPQRIVVAPVRVAAETATRIAETDVSAAAWEALSEGERGDLLTLALVEVLAGDSESGKSLVRRRGVDAMPVILCAKKLAFEKFGGR